MPNNSISLVTGKLFSSSVIFTLSATSKLSGVFSVPSSVNANGSMTKSFPAISETSSSIWLKSTMISALSEGVNVFQLLHLTGHHQKQFVQNLRHCLKKKYRHVNWNHLISVTLLFL